MATFRAFAKVLEHDDPSMRIYEAGLRACAGKPGIPLADFLERSGGVYLTTAPLGPQLRDDIREVAELTSDADRPGRSWSSTTAACCTPALRSPTATRTES